MITFWPNAGETETPYSIAARIHHVRGDASSAATSQWLFGFPTAAGLKDIPRHLDHFVRATAGLLGTPSEILKNRTVLGVYARFIEPAEIQRWIAWCSGKPSANKPFVSLRSTKLPASHPLRACLQCMDEDFHALGSPIWRVEHQLPATRVCVHHRSVLHELSPVRGRLRNFETKWVRPADGLGDGRLMEVRVAAEHQSWWEHVAKTMWVLHCHPRVCGIRLHQIMVTHLAHLGVVATARRFDAQKINAWWAAHPRPDFRDLPGYEGFHDARWIRDLLLRRRCDHPIRWAFLSASVMTAAELERHLSAAPSLQATFDGDWAALDGNREDMLKPHVWKLLLNGMDISEVAKRSGMPAPRLRHALSQSPRLQAARNAVRAEQELAAKRSIIQDVLKRNPSAGRAELLKLRPAELRWLELHDPQIGRAHV